MHKPWMPAPDLANEDIIEDDPLVIGPANGRNGGLRNGGVPGCTSFRDSSILGGTTVSSKLGTVTSVPVASSRTSAAPTGIYGKGTGQVIATAASARPQSGLFVARSARTSAPGPDSANSYEGDGPDVAGVTNRMQGDILGDPEDDGVAGYSARGPSSGGPQGHRGSSQGSGGPGYGPGHSQVLRSHNGTAPNGAGHGAQGGPTKPLTPAARYAAAAAEANRMPGLDAEDGERNSGGSRTSALAGSSSMALRNGRAPLDPASSRQVAVHPKGESRSAGGFLPDSASSSVPLGATAGPRSSSDGGRPASGKPRMSASGAGSGGGGKEGGLLGLFSRHSSARPKEAKEPKPAKAPKAERGGDEDVAEVLASGGVGGGRPPSGLLKRTASALVNWAR
ncbi:hypothetical protein HYH03_015890 [Edaphochlamys debaryana]|uniref:Uncharacterized protein n=1 Tax=Edaphochlamys debaryana TaxID=47281 RepID=A0A835XSX3_9CHLO|nr:hypothetical protein HYH03_015890 [Edaphochlamys debaryana]|eukprot:KAG2485404.1 hypothetical protein HYH03_015890 [Edaphochlamys debaryana]